MLVATTSFSQVFTPGIIAGISGAQIEGDGYGGYHKLGFIAGAFARIDLSRKVTSQFEIYFINKGSFDAIHPDKGDYDKLSINLNYIEVPFIIGYKSNKIKFEAGLYLSKLFGTPKLEDEFGPVFVNQYPFKSFDFGGLIGLSYQVNEYVSFNLRSKNSIIPIRDFQNQDQNVGIFNKLFNQGWYNVDLNFTFRYHFVNK
ncbi:PorT family protein [Vicingaceae bacterium]|nr:PorT family protein [Vicingaceae bacterium]